MYVTNTNWIAVTNIGHAESSRFAIFLDRGGKGDNPAKWNLNIPNRTRCRTFGWLSRERLLVAVSAVWDFGNSVQEATSVAIS